MVWYNWLKILVDKASTIGTPFIHKLGVIQIMEEKLTQEELSFIEEGIDLYKRHATKVLKNGALVSAISALVGYFIIGFSLRDIMIILLGLFLIIIYIWYYVFERPKIRLRLDFDKGIKIIQEVTVKKIKNKKEDKLFLMSNGIEVKENDFDDNKEILVSVERGVELILTYTPYQKMIINIKRKSTAPNTV